MTICLLAGALKAAQAPPAASGPPNGVKTVQVVLQSLGVNTHLDTRGNAYWAITKGARDQTVVLNMLHTIGVSLIRDGVPGANGNGNAADVLQEFGVLADAGIRFDWQIDDGSHLDDKVMIAARFAQSHPQALAAMEGLNEVGSRGVAYAGSTGPAGVNAVQDALYALVRRDDRLAGVDVYNFSLFYDVEHPVDVFGPGGPHADALNLHPYADEGRLPWEALLRSVVVAEPLLPNKPLVITENGISSGPSPKSPASVDELVQAKYTLNAVCDGFSVTTKGMYLYELMDGVDTPGGFDAEHHFGLFHHDGTPKLAADAVAAFTSILRKGAKAFPTPPAAIPFVATSASEHLHTLALAKSAGVFDILVWNETRMWDHRVMHATTSPPVGATIAFKTPMRSFQTFDPLVSGTPIQSGGSRSRIDLILTDHPIILEVSE